jgi:DNA-binding FadR family transcriptional regulator
LDLTPFQDYAVTYKGRREALASLEIHRWCPSRHGVDRSALDFPILKH